MYLRAAVETHEVVEKLNQMATQLLEEEESANGDEEYQPLQEIIQLALWENLDPALGIRVMLAVKEHAMPSLHMNNRFPVFHQPNRNLLQKSWSNICTMRCLKISQATL